MTDFLRILYVLVAVCVSLMIGIAVPVLAQNNPNPIPPWPELGGPMIGQQSPGLKAELFAPGVVSIVGHTERDMAFSTDMTEIYFGRNARIHVTRLENGHWTEPAVVPFTGDYNSLEPFVRLDNQRMYFISQRPLAGSGEPEPWQIWYVDRTPDGWSDAVRFTSTGEYFPTMTRDGVMLVTAEDELYLTRDVDGHIGPKELLPPEINSDAAEYNAYISPDGSYIIYTSTGHGPAYGGADLYINFRKSDGAWTEARNMGYGINSAAIDYCPSVSPDGKYFFFASGRFGRLDIFWVDAAIIDTLRVRELDPGKDLRAVAARNPKQLRTAYDKAKTTYGTFAEFGPDLLESVGNHMLTEGRLDAASAAYQLNTELYPDGVNEFRRLKYALVSGNDAAFARIADKLRDHAGSLGRAEELQINRMAYHLLFSKQPKLAKSLFSLNTELFPESGNVYDSYGECLLTLGDTTAAVANYRLSLEKDPTNQNASTVLANLGVK